MTKILATGFDNRHFCHMTRDDILRSTPRATSFFDGFKELSVDIDGSRVFARVAGTGPPLLLLHGYPQTSAMWHRIAPDLARDYTVIAADLRGYGRSAAPATSGDHAPYSKRAMAQDLIGLLDALGHDRVLIGAHDRGARVAHRLAADHPDRVRALALLDIAPTREMYAGTTAEFATLYWHWFFLIQPAPFPERMIATNPDAFWLKKCGSGSAGMTPFVRQALREYLEAFSRPEVIHASCEDYRAACGIDIEHDNAEDGRLPVPLLVNWGRHGVIERCFDPLELWRSRATDVRGASIEGGHYLAEEAPEAVLSHWRPFFMMAPA